MNTKTLDEFYREAPAPSGSTEDHGLLMDALPVVDEPPVQANEHSLLGLTELILKNPRRIELLTRDEARQAELIPRFLAIALASFSIFSLALVLLLTAAPREAVPGFFRDTWSRHSAGPAISLWLAYTLGLVAATGICLPSFYFYGLLSGIQISVLQVTAQVMKGKASTAVFLLGILPVYVAFVLGLIVFGASNDTLEGALYAGLTLPFLAGMWGVRAIYYGFMGLADTLPPERRCRRECFLRRLTLACAGCYTAVTPVMIYTLWTYFAGKLA